MYPTVVITTREITPAMAAVTEEVFTLTMSRADAQAVRAVLGRNNSGAGPDTWQVFRSLVVALADPR